ncbi:MAG: pyoverdin chromophore biosynthetic protein pvcC [Rhizobiaceae bacterium MnEN-MB40S]|nr:MAG: pyoverdin chromophore biosynthetic protein pvcC [Rhizobiaceae bacterium MnEN-MB40S]
MMHGSNIKIRQPYTGDEYLGSLSDGRTIFIHGERVRDVTKHPAFRNSARMVARWYDKLHAEREKLAVPTDTGSGGWTHPFFLGPKSTEDLVKSRDCIAELQKISFGWMGRSPDYKGAFLGTLGANAEFYGDYSQNARNWYARTQERLDYWNHAIVNPPIDRDKPVEDVRDIIIHVERETDAGVVVSGAKVVATGSALTHFNFIAHYGVPVKDKSFALIFTAPMDAEGVKLISRTSYELNASMTGSPFDYPLSSRMDENDSILVFDNVLVPWENIFLYGDIDKINSFFPASGFVPRFTFHGCTRLAVKLDFIAGLFSKAVEATGTKDFRGVQVAVGEVVAWANLFRGLSDAMATTPVPWTDGYVLPNPFTASAYRVFAPMAYGRIRELIQRHVASGLIYLPGSVKDFESDEVRPYLDRFVRGSNGYSAVDRVKLLKLLWDAMGSEFGGRHALYETNYGGNHEDIRIQTLFQAMGTGQLQAMQGFVDQCLSEYDMDGWTNNDLVNPDDVNALKSLVDF